MPTTTLTIISSPEKTIGSPAKTANWYCVNNPLVWVVHTDQYSSPDDYRLKVEVYDTTGGTVLYHTELYFPDAARQMTIDLSEVLRSMLILENTFDYNIVNGKEPRIYKAIQIVFQGMQNNTEDADEATYYQAFFILHSAKQLGDMWGSTMGDFEPALNFEGKFLTFFDKPKYWEGYPFSIDFLFPWVDDFDNVQRNERTISKNGNVSGYSQTELIKTDADALNHLMLAGSYANTVKDIDVFIETILSGNHETYIDVKRIEIADVCELRPFYVRWINELAGSEYWLFNINQIHEISISEQEIKRLYVTELSTSFASHQTRSARKAVKYTLGADKVTTNEYEVLSRQLGGTIECQVWIDGNWFTALVVPNSYQMETKNDNHNFEFQIILPELYNQKR